MIGGLVLPHIAVALTRWPTDDDIHGIDAEILREFCGREGREVFAQRENFLRKVGLESRDGLLIEINRREAAKAGASEAETEPAASAEEIEEGRGVRFHARTPAQSSDTVMSSAFATRAMLTRLGLRTPRSMPLM